MMDLEQVTYTCILRYRVYTYWLLGDIATHLIAPYWPFNLTTIFPLLVLNTRVLSSSDPKNKKKQWQ